VSVTLETRSAASARPRREAPGTLAILRETGGHGDRFWRRARAAVDLALLGVAVAIADLLSGESSATARALWPAAFAALVAYLSWRRKRYSRQVKLDNLDTLRETAAALAVSAGAVVTARVLLGSGADPGISTVRLVVAAAVLLGCGRIGLNLWQLRERRRGNALVPTLIVGAGRVGHLTAKRLLDNPGLGLRPVGYLDKEPMDEGGTVGLPVLGASWDFDDVVAAQNVGQVIVTFSTAPAEVLLRIVSRCEELGIEVALVPRLFEKATEQLTIEHLGGLPLVTPHPSNPRGWRFALKYAVDRIVAVLLLCVLSPVLVACALAVWVSLGRPILFRQRRVGCDGREFEMLKFRSMRPGDGRPQGALDLPDDTAPGGLAEAPSRVTRVGRFLRATSLDELPQLLNVLRGEMSLVGPRPERPEFVELFEGHVHRYFDRHRVKAGITGWAQVNGLRGRTSLSDRVEWDNFYIDNASLWLDVKIIGRTLLAPFRLSE
jgi:exopolysaccharide biosynthesis polyprenyl glycosylphosphotransferase